MPQQFNANPRPMMDLTSILGAPLRQTLSTKSISSPQSFHPSIDGNRYKTVMCDKYSVGYCPYGDKCHYAHGEHELRRRPRHPKWKTELCRNFHTTGLCPYGERCDYVHNEPIPIPPPNPHNRSLPIWSGTAGPNQLNLANSWMPLTGYPPQPPAFGGSKGIGGSSDWMMQSTAPYLYHGQSISSCMAGSVSYSPSCTDSPPPSSSSCAPSPDLMMDHPALPHHSSNCRAYPAIPSSGNASSRSTGSTSSQISDGNACELDSPTSRTQYGLDQLYGKLQRLGICRLDRFGKAMDDDDVFVDGELGDMDHIFDKPLRMPMNSDRRLPTFAWLTSGNWTEEHERLEPALG